MYFDRRGNRQKPPRAIPFRQKTPGQTPWTKPPRAIEIEFVQRDFLRSFSTRPTKDGGPRCVTYFWGSWDVWQSVTEGGGRNWPTIWWRTLWTAPRCKLTFPTSKMLNLKKQWQCSQNFYLHVQCPRTTVHFYFTTLTQAKCWICATVVPEGPHLRKTPYRLHPVFLAQS